MGKTQGSACQSFFSRGGFSNLRSTAAPPSSRRIIDYSLGLPEHGILDTSEYQDGLLPEELVSAVAPLSAVHEDVAQAEAHRQRLIENFSQQEERNWAFLPEEYQGGSPDHMSFGRNLGYNLRAIERFWKDRPLDPQANIEINKPLEILVSERYTPASQTPNPWSQKRGVGHYVYDPLTERWLLVDRWGRGEKKKRTQTITPYMQSAANDRRMRECLEKIQNAPLQVPEDFAQASTDQVEESMKAIRQQRQARWS